MTVTDSGKVVKDFHRLMKNIDSFSDGQAQVADWDESNINQFKINIRPKEGPYQGGEFKFEVTVPDEYPANCPGVTCKTPIYHPNIDPYGDNNNVCLSLFNEWSESYTLEDMVQGLLFLIYNPQVDDALSPLFDGDESYETFLVNVRASLVGKEVRSFNFETNVDDVDNVDNYVAGIADEALKKRMLESGNETDCEDDDDDEDEPNDVSNVEQEEQKPVDDEENAHQEEMPDLDLSMEYSDDGEDYNKNVEEVANIMVIMCNVTGDTADKVRNTDETISVCDVDVNCRTESRVDEECTATSAECNTPADAKGAQCLTDEVEDISCSTQSLEASARTKEINDKGMVRKVFKVIIRPLRTLHKVLRFF